MLGLAAVAAAPALQRPALAQGTPARPDAGALLDVPPGGELPHQVFRIYWPMAQADSFTARAPGFEGVTPP